MLTHCEKVLLSNRPKDSLGTWLGLSTPVLCNRITRSIALEQGISKASAAMTVFRRIRSLYGGLVQLLKRYPLRFHISKSGPLVSANDKNDLIEKRRSAITHIRVYEKGHIDSNSLTRESTLSHCSACLHIAHIEPYMTEAWLRREFSQYGVVDRVCIKKRGNGGKTHE